MAGEFKMSILVVAGVAGALVIGFSFPPITGSRGEVSISEKEQATARRERSYCRANLDDVNCACFARKAGHVLSHDEPRVQGFKYAEKSTLARGQAKQNC